MSINLTEPETADLTIQQASRRTGLAESALRYYERIGLIDRVPRDESRPRRARASRYRGWCRARSQ